MHGHWNSESTRLTPNEADQVVELWLRQRITGAGDLPVNTSALTLPDLAQALGAREEEVALMLVHIRDKKNLNRRRRAIPVKRSWAIIAAIYVAVLALGIGAFSIGRQTAPQGFGNDYYRRSWRSSLSPVSRYLDRNGTSYRLPQEFGFTYRDAAMDAGPNFRESTLDWELAEKALVEAIISINSEAPVNLTDAVSAKDVPDALANPPKPHKDADGSPAETINNALVEWHTLILEVDNHHVSTTVPAAKVANELVEKAVRDVVKQRVAKLLKAMKSRVSPSDVITRPNMQPYGVAN
jgi:hypothetical protein